MYLIAFDVAVFVLLALLVWLTFRFLVNRPVPANKSKYTAPLHIQQRKIAKAQAKRDRRDLRDRFNALSNMLGQQRRRMRWQLAATH